MNILITGPGAIGCLFAGTLASAGHSVQILDKNPERIAFLATAQPKALKRGDVGMVMNPLDKNAMEAALAIKKEQGAHITVVSMGPPAAGNIVKECLALGGDRGVLLSDRAFGGADTFATAFTLASGIKKIGIPEKSSLL